MKWLSSVWGETDGESCSESEDFRGHRDVPGIVVEPEERNVRQRMIVHVSN